MQSGSVMYMFYCLSLHIFCSCLLCISNPDLFKFWTHYFKINIWRLFLNLFCLPCVHTHMRQIIFSVWNQVGFCGWLLSMPRISESTLFSIFNVNQKQDWQLDTQDLLKIYSYGKKKTRGVSIFSIVVYCVCKDYPIVSQCSQVGKNNFTSYKLIDFK